MGRCQRNTGPGSGGSRPRRVGPSDVALSGVCSPGKRTPKVAARFATVPDQQKPYRRANTPLRVKELERDIATDLLRLSLWPSRLRRGRAVVNSIDVINTEMARGLQRRQHRRALPVGLLRRTTARAPGIRVQVRSAL